jgi:protein-S-isoprenylcysteine O-methyltransferase Ste14
MSTLVSRLWKIEFEGRIFVSCSIAAAVVPTCLVGFPDLPSTLGFVGDWVGLPPEVTLRFGYGLLAVLFGLCALVRMWAGSLLTPERVMAFEVQTDAFIAKGPYRFVRNPIYWSDLSALTLLAVCLPWPGLVMPALFYLHYVSIICYEEAFLSTRYGEPYRQFMAEVSRLVPTFRSVTRLPQALKEFHITSNGARHNALFVLIIPGMIVSAATLNLTHALLIGLPSVLDWAVIHTIIGVRKRA